MTGRTLYFEKDYPVFQNRMYESAEAGRNCAKGTICLIEDETTGIVGNAAFEPELMIYDSQYQNEQANSRSFLSHLEEVRELVLKQLGRENLIEVGCGKAFFLEMLQVAGAEIKGFDPTYEGSNPLVERHYFTKDVGLRARGIVLRHVLEHVPDPAEFLAQIAAANGHQGLIYIEVPCFDWISKHKAWFDIYYEHVNYFRMADFGRMFGRIIEQGRLFGDQYLYVIADLSTIRRPRRDPNDPVSFPDDFTASIMKLGNKNSDKPTVIWGGASKGVIFALLAERAGKSVDRVIDINPAKQGAFLAGTGLRVMSPQEALADLPAGSPIYVMNPNYLDEIRADTHGVYSYIGVGNDGI